MIEILRNSNQKEKIFNFLTRLSYNCNIIANKSRLTLVKVLRVEDFHKNYSSDNYLFIKDEAALNGIKILD